MTVGYSTMGVPGSIPCGKHNCLIFLSTANGTPLINKFFLVDDRITSFWNPDLQKPVWIEKNLNEGNFHKKYEATFYSNEKKVDWKLEQISGNTKKGKKREDAKWKYKKGTTYNLPDDFQDILSAVFFLRSIQAKRKLNQFFTINLFDDLKMSILKIKIIRQEEIALTVNKEEKKIPSVVVQPFFQTSGIFKKAGEIFIWISDDARKIPLKIRATIPFVGNVDVELIEDNFLQ